MNPRPLVAFWAVARLLAVAALSASFPSPVRAQSPGPEPRVPVGKCLSADGSLLARPVPGKPWQSVANGGAVHSRDLLLTLPGGKAFVEPRPDSVRLTLWGNVPQLSEFPGRECAVLIHDSRSFDLDFTLVRGRVVVANKKAKGSAKVCVRLPEDAWELTLAEPGDEVALEMFGRWPRGVGFSKTPRDSDVPTRAAVLLVLKGSAVLKTEARKHTLAAPPGPAYFTWDSVIGEADGPQRAAAKPAWANAGAEVSVEGRALLALSERFRGELKERDPAMALRELLTGAAKIKDPTTAALTRQFALLGLTGLDDLAPVTEALADEKLAGLRAQAVLALRHWIGEAMGRDLVLYNLLADNGGYSKAQAETILQLLHSPFEQDQPETYETLINLLGYGKLAVRELAAFHLYRLAPAGKDIAYDPAASEADRNKAIAAWKKLIPSGKLPPGKKE